MSDTSQQTSSERPLQIDEEELKRLNHEMIMSDLITPDRLYMDLCLVKDFNIGALQSFRYERKPTIPAEAYSALYQSILDGLPAYQSRTFDDIPYYFPKFELTADQIKDRLHDPKWSSHILHDSPLTPFHKTIQAQILVNINHSKVAGKKDAVHLTINTYPIQLNHVNTNIVGMYFADLLKVEVYVVYWDLTKITLKDMLPFDEIYTYYYNLLFSHEDISAAYTNLKFITKRLFTPKILGTKVVPNVDIQRAENIIDSQCNVLTLFKFMSTKTVSAMSP